MREWPQNLGLLLLRIIVGASIALLHGVKKLPPSPGFIEGVGKMGFPEPHIFAWAATLAEFLGGILILLGLGTRVAAFFVAATMTVAFFIRHAADPMAQKELALIYLGSSLALLFLGGGAWGLENYVSFGRKRR